MDVEVWKDKYGGIHLWVDDQNVPVKNGWVWVGTMFLPLTVEHDHGT